MGLPTGSDSTYTIALLTTLRVGYGYSLVIQGQPASLFVIGKTPDIADGIVGPGAKATVTASGFAGSVTKGTRRRGTRAGTSVSAPQMTPDWITIPTQQFQEGQQGFIYLRDFLRSDLGFADMTIGLSSVPAGFTYFPSNTQLVYDGVTAPVSEAISATAKWTSLPTVNTSNQFTVTAGELITIPLESYFTLDHANQRLVVAADTPLGTYGPFEFAISGADDQVNPITWDAGAQLNTSPGATVPYSSILTDDSSHTVVRDVGSSAIWSQDLYDLNWNGTVQTFGYWNPANFRLVNYAINNGWDFAPLPPYGTGGQTSGRPLNQYYNMYDYGTNALGIKAVTWPRYNLKDDYFWIQKIGSNNDFGVDNGVTFADGIATQYPLMMHVLDNWFLDPAKRIKTSSIIGTLPTGFSYDARLGELIYDGTPGGVDIDRVLAYRVEDSRGHVKERSFRFRVIVPQLVYSDTGTHWYTATGTAQQASLSQYARDVKAAAGDDRHGNGNVIIYAIKPHVIDWNLWAELADNEGLVTWNGTESVAPRTNKIFRDHFDNTTDRILGAYGEGVKLDPDNPDHRVWFSGTKKRDFQPDTYTGNPNEQGWLGVMVASGRTTDDANEQQARIKYDQRSAYSNLNFTVLDTGSKQVRSWALTNCLANLGYPIEDGFSGSNGEECKIWTTGIIGHVCPTFSSLHNVEVCGGGNGAGTKHQMYNHGGDGGRANYVNCHFYENSGSSSNMIKAYSIEQYFIGTRWSSLKEISDFYDPTKDKYWQNAKEVYHTGTVQDYTGSTITLDANDPFDYMAETGTFYVRVLPVAEPGRAFRRITAYDPVTKIATLGDCEAPLNYTWPAVSGGESYETYRIRHLYYGGPLLDQGPGGVTVIDQCEFECLTFVSPGPGGTSFPYGTNNVGPNFVMDLAIRREWNSVFHPMYGTKECMDPQWWDDFTNLHGGCNNPNNPWSTKFYLSNTVFRKHTPTISGYTSSPTDMIETYYCYPSSVYPDESGQGGNNPRGYLWMPMSNPVTADGEYIPGANKAWSNQCAVFMHSVTFEGLDHPNDRQVITGRGISDNLSDQNTWDLTYWQPYRDDPANEDRWPGIDVLDTFTGSEDWWL